MSHAVRSRLANRTAIHPSQRSNKDRNIDLTALYAPDNLEQFNTAFPTGISLDEQYFDEDSPHGRAEDTSPFSGEDVLETLEPHAWWELPPWWRNDETYHRQ